MVDEWSENQVITAEEWNHLFVRHANRNTIDGLDDAEKQHGDVFARIPIGLETAKITTIDDSSDRSDVPTETPVGTIRSIVRGTYPSEFHTSSVDDQGSLGALNVREGVDPYHWVPCDGREMNQFGFSELYNVIGTTYGAGTSGVATFKLPNIEDRYIRSATEDDDLGDGGGANSHTLTIDEMAAHTHTYTTSSGGRTTGDGRGARSGSNTITINTRSTGDDQPHENRPASVCVQYFIKVRN